MTESYVRAPAVAFPVAGRRVLFYLPTQGETRILSALDAELLASCDRFRTLAEHAQNSQPFTTDWLPVDTTRLEELARMGLLIPSTSILETLEESEVSKHADAISWLAIPTRSRPTELRRAIHSYMANANQFGGSHGFLIADDSETDEHESAARQIAIQAATECGTQVCFAGRPEREAFVNRVSSEFDIPKDILSFALFGPSWADSETFGANRNAVLLHTHRSMCVSVDDDTICSTGRVPGSDLDRLALGQHGDLGEVWSFLGRTRALEFVDSVDIDFIREHEKFLGRGFTAVLKSLAASSHLSLDHFCNHFHEALWTDSATIRFTTNGYAGDSAFYTAMPIRLLKSLTSQERLSSSAAAYHAGISSRDIVRQATCATVTHINQLMGIFLGMDNRQLTVPFVPIGRGEDELFGLITSRIFDHAYSVALPFSLVHDPQEGRTYSPCHISWLQTAMRLCLDCWSGTGVSAPPEERLKSLGRHLTSLGTSGAEDFAEFLRMGVLNLHSQAIMALEAQLGRQDCLVPEFRALDIERQIEALESAILSPSAHFPTDLFFKEDDGDRLRRTQEIIHSYGDLLQWWPAILECSDVLADRGFTLGIPV